MRQRALSFLTKLQLLNIEVISAPVTGVEQSSTLLQGRCLADHDFVRAHALVSTRALPFGQELTMIPYLDMANHRKGATNSCGINVMPNDDPKKEEFAAVITTEAPVKAGEEVLIDYCTGSSRASRLGSGRASSRRARKRCLATAAPKAACIPVSGSQTDMAPKVSPW